MSTVLSGSSGTSSTDRGETRCWSGLWRGGTASSSGGSGLSGGGGAGSASSGAAATTTTAGSSGVGAAFLSYHVLGPRVVRAYNIIVHDEL